ncbi:hypothetical protein [Actinoplanes sp. NPDC026670]|uniref:hypothetical protein n=1 Tax=Actinoplanes sp. NPDC026670 TaxID=3154700 RepID=UPI0033F2BD43
MSAHWSQAAQALMLPGESLRAALTVGLAPGNMPHQALPDPPVWTRYKFLMVSSVLLGLTKPLDYLPERASDWLHGVAAAGEPGSRAARLVQAHQSIRFTRQVRVTVVTDRRLLLCAADQPDRLTARWEVARTDITSTRWERYRLQRRFRVDFVDSSWIAYGTPRLKLDGAPRALAAAFQPGHRPSGSSA